MKLMKKIALLLVFFMLMTAFVACNGTDDEEVTEEENGTIDTDNGEEEEAALEDRETDVVIIGAGGAGLAAALEAREAGHEVVIVEKMSFVGGNTLRATGGLNAAGTSPQEDLGIEDSWETHYEDTMTGGQEMNDPELVEILTRNAADAVEWLIDMGADLSDVGRLGGSSENRTHRPTGGAAVGPHLVDVLRTNAEDQGVEILTNTEAIEILEEAGSASGIVVQNGDDEYTISASAVVVATGGFGSNTTMLVDYDENLEGFGTTNHPGAQGDGITMAQSIGAALVDMEEIQTHPTVNPEEDYMITEAVRGNGAILVNLEGQRFVDELGTRDVVSEATLDQTEGYAYLVFDHDLRESLSAIEGYEERGLVTEGETLEELAEALEMDVEELENTVTNYNAFVEAGTDEDFGREDLEASIAQGPFYAIAVGPAVHHTMGGIQINERAQVLNEDGEVIEGLYAAGETVGGIHGANRLGGNALADLMVFGRLAGQSIGEDL